MSHKSHFKWISLDFEEDVFIVKQHSVETASLIL